MVKLQMALWDLLARGALMYIAVVFVLRGRLLKRQALARDDNPRAHAGLLR